MTSLSRALATAMSADRLGGERVAIMLPNSSETALAYQACFAAGAVAVPMNPRYAAPEVTGVLRRSRPRWLIMHPSRRPVLDAVDRDALEGVRILQAGDSLDELLREAGPADLPQVSEDSPAVIFFTSGSTGVPKGVVHSQASVHAMLTSTGEALGHVRSGDVTLVFEPQAHVSGFIGTFSTLLAGGTVALHDGFDPVAYVDALRTQRPTLICTHIDVLAQVLQVPGIDRATFASLRGVFTGGDTVPGHLQQEFTERTGLPVGVGWGMTEAIWLTVDPRPPADPEGSIGRPVDGVEIANDPRTGELLVRGLMVMRRYWQDPELTAATLRDGWLRTGDLGRRDDNGGWWFTGRLKDIIVRRTSKITPGEVESALQQHPAVAIAAVVAGPDPEEGQVPVAFVVPRAGTTVTADELEDFLLSRIAAYKVPARIHVRGTLPLTASGKIARYELREDADR